MCGSVNIMIIPFSSFVQVNLVLVNRLVFPCVALPVGNQSLRFSLQNSIHEAGPAALQMMNSGSIYGKEGLISTFPDGPEVKYIIKLIDKPPGTY